MEQENADILRRNIRDILSYDQHCLHVLYMQAERVEMLVARDQAQVIIKSLISAGHSVVNDYSIVGMQVRQERSSKEQLQRRNEKCAHRALTRTLSRGNLGGGMNLFYEKRQEKVKDTFAHVFTAKRRAEFDLEYIVLPKSCLQSRPPPRTQVPDGAEVQLRPCR